MAVGSIETWGRRRLNAKTLASFGKMGDGWGVAITTRGPRDRCKS